MKHPRHILTLALIASLGLTGSAFAQQRAEVLDNTPIAEKSAKASVKDAKQARKDAEAARLSAEAAADRTDPAADADAHVAHEAAVDAQQARNNTIGASMDAQSAGNAANDSVAPGIAASEAQQHAAGARNAAAQTAEAAARARSAAAGTPPGMRPAPESAATQADPTASTTTHTGMTGADMAGHTMNSAVVGGTADFNALDADRNGSISRAEAGSEASLNAAFGTADTNGDGRVSREELDAWNATQR